MHDTTTTWAKKALALIRTSNRLSEDKSLQIEEQFVARVSATKAKQACLALEDYPTPTTADLYHCLANAYWAGLTHYLAQVKKSSPYSSGITHCSVDWDPAAVTAIIHVGGWKALCVAFTEDAEKAHTSYMRAFRASFTAAITAAKPQRLAPGTAFDTHSWGDAYVLMPEWVEQGLAKNARKITAEERI